MAEKYTITLSDYDIKRVDDEDGDGNGILEFTHKETGNTVTVDDGELTADQLKSLTEPTEDTDVATKYYVDNNGGGGGGASSLSDLSIDVSKDWGGYDITNLGEAAVNTLTASQGTVSTSPSTTSDIATKGYVDSQVGTGGSGAGNILESLSVTKWNQIDVTNEGYTSGDTSHNLGTLFSNNPDCTFILPKGTYYQSSRFQPTDMEWFGLIGQPHATIKVNGGYEGTLFDFGENGYAKNMLFKNLTIDITDANVDAGFMMASIQEYGVIENVDVVGARDRYNSDGTTRGDRYNLRLHATKEDAVNYVRGLRMPDGGTHNGSGTTGHAIGVRSGEPPHVGTNIFEGCYVEGFVDNGFYMKGNNGQTILRGCTAKNCSNSLFRPGTNDRIESCKAIQTDTSSIGVPQVLRVEEAEHATVDGLYIQADDTSGQDVIKIMSNSNHTTLKNIRMDVSDSVKALEAQGGSGFQTLQVSNFHINDTASDATKNSLINVMQYRDRCTFDNITVESNQRGAFRIESGVTSIHNSTFNCPDQEVIQVGHGSNSHTIDRLTIENSTFDTANNYEPIVVHSGATLNRLDLRGNELVKTQPQSATVDGTVNQWRVRDNWGLVSHEYGTATVSDGDTISHPLGRTPSLVNLTAQADGVTAGVQSVNSNSITVELRDTSNSRVTSNTDVFWEARW